MMLSHSTVVSEHRLAGGSLGLRARRAALTAFGSLSSGGGSGVICLHSVRNDAPSGFWPARELTITPRFLDQLLRDLRAQNVPIVSLDEAFARLQSRDRERFIAFTFDDGYADNLRVALPVFQRHGAPFAVFVATGFVDRTAVMWWAALESLIRHHDVIETPREVLLTHTDDAKSRAYEHLDGYLRFAVGDEAIRRLDGLLALNPGGTPREDALGLPMNWDLARAASRTGLVTFGCHTVTHPVLATLNQERARAEIVAARDRLTEELGVAPRHFAYPYGGADEIGDIAPDVVREAGFTAAWTTRRNLLDGRDASSPYLLPRITLDGRLQDSRVLRAYLSGVVFKVRDRLNAAARFAAFLSARRSQATPARPILSLLASALGVDVSS